jgi:hypothetical protein
MIALTKTYDLFLFSIINVMFIFEFTKVRFLVAQMICKYQWRNCENGDGEYAIQHKDFYLPIHMIFLGVTKLSSLLSSLSFASSSISPTVPVIFFKINIVSALSSRDAHNAKFSMNVLGFSLQTASFHFHIWYDDRIT